jgi:hypothetical protein
MNPAFLLKRCTLVYRSVKGVLPKSISATAERGCLSRSTFDKPKTRGISCAHSAIRAAAGGRHPRSVSFGQYALDTRAMANGSHGWMPR